MSYVQYKGAHDIAFWNLSDGDKRPKFAWDNFHLIPKSRPFINVSTARYSIISIPKSSNILNVTRYLPGGLTYSEHTGKWDFYIDHEEWDEWNKSFRTIRDYFNGQRLYVSLMDDPQHIYVGRFKVSSYSPGDNYSSISIEYDLDYEELAYDQKNDLKYRVRFIDEYGNNLQATFESYGAIPIYTDSLNKYNNHKVIGYDKKIEPISGNIDYITYVDYSLIDYTHGITFINLDDEETYYESPIPVNMNFVIL